MSKRRTIIVAATIAALIGTACTPEQVATWERVNGMRLDAKTRSEAIAAPDVRIKTRQGWIELDGTITPYTAPAGSRCPQWFATAMITGWPEADWPKLDRVIWGESRCNPNVYNGKGRDDSRGLVQINTKQGSGNRPFIGPFIDYQWDRLYDPETNLWVARRMYDYWQANSWSKRCGWWGWTTRDRAWCG
jgi:hypothetical protein